jgi:hypothetical protein
LLYALNRIKAVAGQRQGADAIQAIVSRFERPADPRAEIAKAIAFYQRQGTPKYTQISPQAGPESSQIEAAKAALLAGLGRGQSVYTTIPQIAAARNAAVMPPGGVLSPSQPLQPHPGVNPSPTPAELFYDPLGGLKFGKQIGAIGGHSDHVHVAYQNAKAMLQALALARRLGLRVSENPYVDHVDPVHATHSFHYRRFPGLYHGRQLGEAADVSGRPALMARYYRLLAGGR